MKILFPTGDFISPGDHMIETVRMETQEVWYMGHLIEEKEVPIYEDHGVKVPDPGLDSSAFPDDPENGWPLRGEFTFADRTFTVVRDDDETFWGTRPDGLPHTKQSWLLWLQCKHNAQIQAWADAGWWDLETSPDGDLIPIKKATQVSIADMAAQNKTLMAHLMVDLGFFASVGQAKKNGWDKPLELGRHELGPKKKRAFVEITP